MTNRLSSLIGRLRGKSPRQLAQYAALRLSEASGAAELQFPLLPEDLADSLAIAPALPAEPPAGRAPRVAWLTVPPRAGSGGHTTLFRMVHAAQEAGYDGTLLLYDRYNGDFAANAATIRRAWPWLTCRIAPVPRRLEGFDAYVASSWPTAHVLAARAGAAGRRLYFIQDFEPYFHPRGAQWALAEDTYRFGFRNIALGEMVRGCLERETGVASDLVPFGCDTDTYRMLPSAGARAGVVFYAKRGNDRRGFDLAVRALELFHERHPEEPIHVCGDDLTGAPFPTVSHGNVTPAQLNLLYNSVVAGIALSFTNISLVAEEMLAAGAVPVVNDSPLARADLPHPHAVWARATPRGIADALGDAVMAPRRAERAAQIAASVAGRSWRPAQEMVVDILADELGFRDGMPAPAASRGR